LRDDDKSSGPSRPAPSQSAEFRVEAATLDSRADVYSMDLVLGGIFVPTRARMPVGSIVTLNLRAHSATAAAVKAIARVAAVVEPGDPDGRPVGLELELLELRPDALSKLSDRPSTPGPSGPGGEAAQTAHSEHVLVVDDEDLIRDEVASMLRECGYRVSTARNGVEALSLVLAEPVDLILTDLNMPTMDGWQLLRLVRSRTKLKHIPIIFLTRLTNDAERLKGYDLGINDYVEKPFTRESLSDPIAKQLAARHSRRSSGPPVLRGDLAQVGIATMLSLFELEQRTGVLTLQRDRERAALHLRGGVVVHVELSDGPELPPGLPQLFHVLDWMNGSFTLSGEPVIDEAQLELRVSHALLAHAKQRDEEMAG